MKYMLVMRATDEAFGSMANADFNETLEIVGKFNEELIRRACCSPRRTRRRRRGRGRRLLV